MTKVAWIIGASSGIGRAISQKLADTGYDLAVSSRNETALRELQASLTPKKVEVFPCDVSDMMSLQAAYAGLKKEFGDIDLMVFSAGVYTPMPLKEFDLAASKNTIEVNLNGALNVFEVIRDRVFVTEKVHLVWISSVAGYRGLPNSAAYGVSKAGLINFAEMQKIELEPFNTKVQLVSPGFVKTRLTDKNSFEMPMIITPEEAADYIVRGMQKDIFNIAFPPRFSFIMKVLRILPDKMYFAVARRLIRNEK